MHPVLAILVLVGFVAVLHLVGTKTEWGKRWGEGVSTFIMMSAIVIGLIYVDYLFAEEAIREGKWANLWILILSLPPLFLFGFVPIYDSFRLRKYRKEK